MLSAPFLRFCVTGAVGYCVDAGGLMVLARQGVDPLSARFLTSPLAVATTFLLNRNWSFDHGSDVPAVSAIQAYAAVQAAGWLVNLALYSLLITCLPEPLSWPLMAITLAAGAGLAVNYAGAKNLVFRG